MYNFLPSADSYTCIVPEPYFSSIDSRVSVTLTVTIALAVIAVSSSSNTDKQNHKTLIVYITNQLA